MSDQKECKRCGTCCKKGGPALHLEDISLINETLSLSDLITIRKCEPAYNPFLDKIVPTESEVIKVSGKENSWECIFFDSTQSSCFIHVQKPIECRLLKCWDTGELLELVGKNYLTRLDIIRKNDPFYKLILQHEKLCPYQKINQLVEKIVQSGSRPETISQLSVLVQNDLQFRGEVVKKFHLPLGVELFCFGRPIFQVVDFESLKNTKTNSG